MIFWIWILVSAAFVFIAFDVHAYHQPGFWRRRKGKGCRIEKED
jgi:hypothetical protein